MIASVIRAGLLAAIIATVPAVAQDSASEGETERGGDMTAISPMRLAAGVREYPARVLRALLQLADDPLVLRQLADEPELLEGPESISPPVRAEKLAAIRELKAMPAIVAVAADHPEELRALRELYTEVPAETEESILRLRVAYDNAGLGAAVAWQEALEADPVALRDYCELVALFCKARREVYEGFPCVQVLKREYYGACPPNEAIIFYAMENGTSATAMRVIESWWATHAPDEVDARILDGDEAPADFQIRPGVVAMMSPEERASMWKPIDAGHGGLENLVPVIMQPPADQPAEALYARAVAEHARLWTPETPVESPGEVGVDAGETPVGVVREATVAGTDDRVPDEVGAHAPIVDRGYVEEPVQDWVNGDNDWDYASGRAYVPERCSGVSYSTSRTYYSPIVTYYCGYPADWPLFYGCDPSWLLRSRICIGRVRGGHRSSVHLSYGTGSRLTTSLRFGGGISRYYNGSRYGHHRVGRVGRRHHDRRSGSELTRVLHDRRTHHRPSLSHCTSGSRRSHATTRHSAATHGARTTLRAGVHRAGRTGGVFGSRIATSPARRTDRHAPSTSHTVRSASHGVRQRTTSSARSVLSRPLTQTGTSSRTVLGRSGGVSRRSSEAVRPSPRDRSRRAVRPRTRVTQPTVIAPSRSGGSRGSSSVSPRRSSSSGRRSAVSPRRGSRSNRGTRVSPHSRTISTRRSVAPARRGGSSQRSPRVSSRSRTSSRPKSVTSSRKGR